MKQKELFKKYIEGTRKNERVPNKKGLVCHLTIAVTNGLNLENIKKIYITTGRIKHLYDRKPAEEFDFIMDNLHVIAKYPDSIHENKKGKKAGDFLFVKQFKTDLFLCSLKFLKTNKGLKIVTSFRTKESYIKNCKLLWNWRDDVPSS